MRVGDFNPGYEIRRPPPPMLVSWEESEVEKEEGVFCAALPWSPKLLVMPLIKSYDL